jgi:hypothetical protein
MTDLDKMLEEGPRVAPEPRMAETTAASGEQRAPLPSEAGGLEGTSPWWRSSGWVRRLVPLGVVVAVLLLNDLGAGDYATLLFVALVVGSLLWSFLRRARV